MINAKLYRNLIRAGIVAAALGHVALSHAGYAQVSPPPGYSPGNGLASGAGGTYTYPSAANAAGYSGGTVRTNAALNVGGRAVSIPVSMRVAANAGRAAAMAIYLHPALRTAAAVATWLGVAKFTYDVADGLWKRVDPNAQTSDGKEYQAGTGPWSPTRESACQAYVAGIKPWGMFYSFSYMNVTLTTCNYMMYDKDGAPASTASAGISSRPSSCPAGWYVTSAGCVQTPPMQTVPQSDFVQGLPDARPMPPELPGIVWPAAWPIEIPEIQPTFIPTGNPVPNPNYDPSKAPGPNNQPYNQPGINVQPAPTPSSPWQVDVQPVNRPTSNPNPGSDPVPNVNPDGTQKLILAISSEIRKTKISRTFAKSILTSWHAKRSIQRYLTTRFRKPKRALHLRRKIASAAALARQINTQRLVVSN